MAEHRVAREEHGAAYEVDSPSMMKTLFGMANRIDNYVRDA